MRKKIISKNKSKSNGIASAISNKVSNQILDQSGLNTAQFINERQNGLVDSYSMYYRNMMADYIYGLFHPDKVFEENIEIKSPNYLPIPTTTFKFKEIMTISPNSSGRFCLYWEPNFLGTEDVMTNLYPSTDGTTKRVYSNLYFNNYDELSGTVPLSYGWRAAIFRNVAQDFAKYRLTSACIKVKYTGKVIDQSGMFAAAATYKDTFRTVMFKPNDYNENYYQLPEHVRDRLASFSDFDNIRQGQWTKTSSVVSNPDGLTCVYIPTDPLNHVFVNNAVTIDSTSQSITNVDSDYNVYSWLTKNTNIAYAICGYGLPPLTECITIEAYYNFEIIVKQEQMPYFNPKIPDRDIRRFKDVIANVSGLVSSTGLITSTKDHEEKTVLNKLKQAFRKAKSLYDDYYPLISPLLKLLV